MDTAVEVVSCEPLSCKLEGKDKIVNTDSENDGPACKKSKKTDEQTKLSHKVSSPEPGCSTSGNKESEVSHSESKQQTHKIVSLDSDGSDIDMDIEDCKPSDVDFTYPIEMDSSDMLNEVEGFVDGRWPSPSERYFTPFYAIDVQSPGDDVCIRIHSNRIFMISLAPSHPVLQENKKIVSCSYKVSEKLDRSQNKVSGKAKHGAQPLQNNSNLCFLTCDDGSIYKIKCCMIGKLIEINERLMENPELLKLEPELGGYIALALPNLKHFEKIKKSLLTQEQYREAIRKRKKEIEQKQEQESIQVSKNHTENQCSHTELKKNGDASANEVDGAESDRSAATEKPILQDDNEPMGMDD